MTERPSERVVDQRVRNRILDCFDYFADGDSAVKKLGFADYFEFLFDWVPYTGLPELPESMSADERAATLKVIAIVRDALEETPSKMSEDDFIATGWPERIRPVASDAVQIFMKRGRSNEDLEEQDPINANSTSRA